MKRCFFFFLLSLVFGSGLAQNSFKTDTLPVSEIDIPIRVSLKPLFALAERQVDTVFTSPDYPAGWVQADCATRYKYYFKRTPLRLSAKGTTLNLGFTGLYKITGSSRVCVSGTAVSPWTPECRCGFEEGDRKVAIGFTAAFALQPNYVLRTRIQRTEPQALNKCTVCFWGQDITSTVLDGLKKELDASRKTMEDSFGALSLRPYIQQAWKSLGEVYTIPFIGYFTLNPRSLRMEKIGATNDLLSINIGISATPVISFVKPQPQTSLVPDMAPAANREGFNIHLEAALQYDSLSKVMNGYLVNKRFDLSEGLIKKHVTIKNTKVYGGLQDDLVIEVEFGGSHSGTIYFTGKPVYNAATRHIEVTGLDYDLKTNDFLLRTARWLFDKKIIAEIKKYASIDMAGYYGTASKTLNEWLNKEWTKGVRGTGSVTDLQLTSVKAQPQHLLIRSHCAGKLAITVTELSLTP